MENWLYADINIICILVLTIILLFMRTRNDKQMSQRLFRRVVILNMLVFSTDLLYAFLNGRITPLAHTASLWTNAMYYVFMALAGACWVDFCEHTNDDQWLSRRGMRFATILPALVVSTIAIASISTEWLFSVDETSTYHRGDLYLPVLMMIYGYGVIASLRCVGFGLRSRDYAGRRRFFTMGGYMIPPILASIIQIYVPAVPLVATGNALAILYVYLGLQEQRISVDVLTQLNNRHHLMGRISALIEHPPAEPVYLLMMDVDRFKEINDRFGHVEGDRALTAVADALRDACLGTDAVPYRYGGDEFNIVLKARGEGDVKVLCDRIERELGKQSEKIGRYTLGLSVGYAQLEPSDTPQTLLARADSMLYEVKAKRKGAARSANL